MSFALSEQLVNSNQICHDQDEHNSNFAKNNVL